MRQVRFLLRNTSGVEGHVGTSGWGLGRVTSESIIHTIFPFIIFSMPSHGACTQMSFCPETPSQVMSPEIPEIGTLATLEGHNLFFKPQIEMRFKAKLYALLKVFQQYVAHHLHVIKSWLFQTFSG